MGVFDNFKIMKESITRNLANVNSNLLAMNEDKDKIKKLNTEVIALNVEIETAYKQIGELFVEYGRKVNEMPDIGAGNVFEVLEPKIERKENLKSEIIALEKKIKDQMILQEKERVISEYTLEKEKLDKALGMDIITNKDYEEKLKYFKNRVTFFDEIRKIEKQYEMQIISYYEMEDKLKEILSR